MSLAARLKHLSQQIAQAATDAGRAPSAIHLLAVSKGQRVEAIQEAYALGLRNFGESYWQEAREKIQGLSDHAITWHYLGALQRNKIKAISAHFDWVHTVCTETELALLSKYRTQGKPLQICIQVTVEGALGRRGVELVQLPHLIAAAKSYPNLGLRGLMVMLKPGLTQEEQLKAFLKVYDAAMLCGLDTLSMGMSDDFPVAIRAGSHWVRIGRALFGERPGNLST